MSCTSRERGFTLIELMIVVAILGILAAVAVPNFTAMYYNVNTQSLAEEAFTLANVAHTMAQRTGQTTMLVVDGTNRHLSVVTDSNANGGPDGGDAVIRGVDFPGGIIVGPASGWSSSALPSPYGFIVPDTACSFCGGGTTGYLMFTPAGRVLDSASSPVQSAFVTFIPERDDANNISEHVRLLTIVGLTGDVRLWKP